MPDKSQILNGQTWRHVPAPALHSGATVVVAVVEPHAIESCARRRHGCALRPVPLHSGATIVVALVEPHSIESCNPAATVQRQIGSLHRWLHGALPRDCNVLRGVAEGLCDCATRGAKVINIDAE